MFVIRSSGSFLLNLNLTSTVAQSPLPSSQEEEEIEIALARTPAKQASSKQATNQTDVRVKNTQFIPSYL
jgi:hypothetical protein